MWSCRVKLFISYSSADQGAVQQLKTALSNLGYNVWFAPERIAAGACFAAEISKAMEQAQVLLLYASCNAIGNATFSGSEEVKTEIKMARERGIPLIPLKVDESLDSGGDASFKYLLKNYQWLDIQAYLLVGEFDRIAMNIKAQLSNSGANLDISNFTEKLQYAENLLKGKQYNLALNFLARLDLPLHLQQDAEILKLIAFLQGKTVKNLPKQQMDLFIQNLNTYVDEMAGPACFLKALLSECYYKKNGYVDITEGFVQLKKIAQSYGRLKIKYILMTDDLFPGQSALVRKWRE